MAMTGNAITDLGLGSQLSQQVAGESEDERKKRMEQMQQQQLLGASPAVSSLFTRRGGSGAGY